MCSWASLWRRIGVILLINAGYRQQFLGHLINSLSVLLRCNDFARIQKAVVGQMGSRPPNSDHDLSFFGSILALRKCFGASSWSNHWAGHHQLLCKIHFLSYVPIQLRNCSLLCRVRKDNASKWWFFWFLVSSWGTHLLSFFTFPVCFRCPMTIKWSTFFFGNFSCSYKKLSFIDCSQLVIVNFWWLVIMVLIVKALLLFEKLLEPPLHCMLAVPGPNMLCMLPAIFAALWSILNLNKEESLKFAFCLTSFL